MNYLIKAAPLWAITIVCLLTVTACKKETEYTAYPFNSIVSFSFTDASGEKIKAAVEGDSLLIYWPSYLEQPQAIIPTITVSEKAIVQPASGTQVPLATGTLFIVTAQDGTSKKYYLKLIRNQPDIMIDESTVQVVYRGNTIKFNSDRAMFRNIIKDAAQTSLYLVNPAGKEVKMNITFIENDAAVSGDAINIPVPDTLTPGAYKIKLVSGIRTRTTTNAIFSVRYKANALSQLSGTYTVQAGGNITMNATVNDDYNASVKSIRVVRNDGTLTDPVYTQLGTLEYISRTATNVTYKFPAGIAPAGTYTLSAAPGATNMIFRVEWSPFAAASLADWTNPMLITATNVNARSAKLILTE